MENTGKGHALKDGFTSYVELDRSVMITELILNETKDWPADPWPKVAEIVPSPAWGERPIIHEEPVAAPIIVEGK